MQINLATPKGAKVDGDWYELAYAGNFIHPVTRKPFVLGKATFASWTKYFKYLTGKGNTIPIVKNHSTDPTQRLGTLEDVRETDNSFWGKIRYNSDEIKLSVKDASFSVGIAHEVTDFLGEKFDSILLHVGVTDYPVLKGLQRLILSNEIIFEQDWNSLGIIGTATEAKVPDVNSGESQKSYLSRCIPMLINEGHPADQAAAICHSKWEKHKMNLEMLTELGLEEGATEDAVLKAIKELKKPSDRPVILSELGLAKDANTETLLATIKTLKAEPSKKDEAIKALTDRIVADRQSRISKLTDTQKTLLSKYINDIESDAFEDTLSLVVKAETFASGQQFAGGNGEELSLVALMEQRAKEYK